MSHIAKDLPLDEVLETVISGLARGCSEFSLPWVLT